MFDKDKSVLPTSIRRYSAGLTRPAKSLYARAGRVYSPSGTRPAPLGDTPPTVAFDYTPLTGADLAYDTTQYPVSGTYSGAVPPWLNDLTAVPADWQWTAGDNAASTARGAQVTAALAYVEANVPGQTYSGTTAQIIEQRYTLGMWDPSVFPAGQVATLTQNWIADDAEFARQRLGGANPNVIRAATTYAIPRWIAAASNAAALGALQTALTTAQAASQLFVCDYTGVIGPAVTNRFVVNGRNLAAPICFFTLDPATNTLLPRAIQITATDATSYIFTPGDPNDPNGDAWLLAKLWVASADQQWWFSGSHLFNTHTIDMIFGIAALQAIQAGTLAADHPLVILAQPFLVKVFDINDLVISAPASGEAGIYQKGSFCDNVLPTGRIGLYQIITDLWSSYSFDASAFPNQVASRGLARGPIANASLPHRDDGQLWWNAIQAFVVGIVSATYTNDAAVAADTGLNAWLGGVQTAFNHDGTQRFTWTPTVARLQEVLTNLLFTCSVQHTTVNDTMFPGWAFTPNGAFAMQAPPPKDAASVTQATVLASLPDPQDANARKNVIESQIAFVMNGTSVVSETLGVDPSNVQAMYAVYPYAAGSAQQQAVTRFWNAIWTGSTSVSAQIAANQQKRVANWTGPTPVPNSVAYPCLSATLTAYAAPQYLNAPAMNAIQI